MKISADYRMLALDALRGKWQVCVKRNMICHFNLDTFETLKKLQHE